VHGELAELLARFLIGGVIVSLFAVLAEMFRPKSFAGLFGAAPSIALATIGITVAAHGKTYAALEARSMIFAAIAFLAYAACVSQVLVRVRMRALFATVALMPVWFAASAAFWLIVRKIP
jgi:hypothetical protein